jgi:hypothetical protein
MPYKYRGAILYIAKIPASRSFFPMKLGTGPENSAHELTRAYMHCDGRTSEVKK